MKPSIGRIVHFTKDGEHFPAIITKVLDNFRVNLYVFPNGSNIYFGGGSYTSITMGINDFDWHWPEREE